MVLVQVKTTAYQGNLQNCLVYAPPSEPFVSSVGFYFPVGSLGLYGTIHAEQCTMNTVQVFENLFVERSQFIVQPNNTVRLTLVAFRSVWAAAAIFALVKFHGPPINRRPSQMKKLSKSGQYAAKKAERAKSSVRVKVEHVFGVVKKQLRFRKTRYRGLEKQQAKFNIMFALANLILADRPCLAV